MANPLNSPVFIIRIGGLEISQISLSNTITLTFKGESVAVNIVQLRACLKRFDDYGINAA